MEGIVELTGFDEGTLLDASRDVSNVEANKSRRHVPIEAFDEEEELVIFGVEELDRVDATSKFQLILRPQGQ